ncbi:MAG: phosphoglycerate dehydrogenase [Acidobacteriota bacterium]
MKAILISDTVSDRALEILADERALSIDYRPGIAPDELASIIARYAALIVRSRTKVTTEILRAASRLEVIGRAGTGVDNIDLEEATRCGVVVMNVPGGNTISAAEHTLAMLLAMARGIPAAHRSMREGRWERGRFVGSELQGKVLGILGMGKIGREVADRARSFGMEVIGHDPFVSAEDAQRCHISFVSLEELLRRADFLTVHTPITDQTRHIIDDRELAACKPGIRIINCARGGIIDEKALAKHIETGHVAGAALDVFEEEPPGDLPFRQDDRVVMTPHLAASTSEAQEKVAACIAEQVRDFLRDGVTRNAVNVTPIDPKVRERSGPYLELAEKLGHFQAQMATGRLRKVTVEYSGEIPQQALPALTVAILKGYFEQFLSGPVNSVNATFIAREKGIQLEEVRTTEPQDYTNLITTVFHREDGAQAIAGTVFGRNLPRIVRLDGFRFDARPEGHLLLVSNDDRPGIVGMVGNLLGREQVNIAHMSLGRDRVGGHAIAIINLDSPLTAGLEDELKRQPGILWVKSVSL